MAKDFAHIPNKIYEMNVFRIIRGQNIPSTANFSSIPQILLRNKRYKARTKPTKHKLTNNEKQELYSCGIKYGLPEGLGQFLGPRINFISEITARRCMAKINPDWKKKEL